MTSPRSTIGIRRLRREAFSDPVLDVSVRCWISARHCTEVILTRVRAAGPGDRGDVLTNVVFTVGMVIIAGVVLTVIRAKATTISNNICTNADPSTC